MATPTSAAFTFRGAPVGLTLDSSSLVLRWAPPLGTAPSVSNVLLYARNGAGREDALQIQAAVVDGVDSELPTVQIRSPTTNYETSVSTSWIALAGVAGDNGAVTQVVWSCDRGCQGQAVGKTNWSMPSIALEPGPNLVTVEAIDAGGNRNGDQILVNRLSAKLTVRSEPAGAGMVDVSPMATNYTPNTPVVLTAQAQSGWLFAYWGGAIAGTQCTASLTMDIDKQVTACFELNDVNGIPYSWLVLHALPTDGTATTLDTDQDGMNNQVEFLCGTDPRNANSCLWIQAFDAIMEPAGGVHLTWPSVAGKKYKVSSTTNLSVCPFSGVASNLLATPPQNSFEDTNVTGSTLFYRIDLEQ